MARETEEGLADPTPSNPTTPPRTSGPLPLQVGGVTRRAAAPLVAPPSSSSSRPAPPPMQGGMFPGGPAAPPMGDSMAAPSGPPSISPPSSASAAFLPPNFQSQLGQAGFFEGAGANPGSGLDPQGWLKTLFSGLSR